MSRLEVRGLTKFFGKNKVLDDVSFTVNDREFFCITGKLGAGKTTILRIVAGLEKPTSGDVLKDGYSIKDLDPSERGVSMFFENLALYPNKSGFENIAFPLRVRRLPENEIRKRVYDTAKLLTISHLLDREPRTYSGGEAQRVALARTIVRDADIYLLDEPLSNLDALLRIQARAEFKRLQRELSKTFVYTTHDPIEAIAIGERVAVLKDGRIHQIDTPDIIYNKPSNKDVAEFVGNPMINTLVCELTALNNKLVLRGEGVTIDVTHLSEILSGSVGRELIVGIRPEHVYLSSHRPADLIAEVRGSEFIGDKYVIYLGLDKGLVLRATQTIEHTYSVGDRVPVSLDNRKLLIFDRQSGRLIN